MSGWDRVGYVHDACDVPTPLPPVNRQTTVTALPSRNSCNRW